MLMMDIGQWQDHDQKDFSAKVQFPMENIRTFNRTETMLNRIRREMVSCINFLYVQ